MTRTPLSFVTRTRCALVQRGLAGGVQVAVIVAAFGAAAGALGLR